MPASTFSLYWDLENDGKYTGTPQRYKIKNDIDAHGTFFDLQRLPGEANASYFKRLQSVIPLRAGPDHHGLVHGITRELGLEEKIGLKISPVSVFGRWLAPAPHVEITATQIILYSYYESDTNNVVDTTIEIFDHGDGYLLEDVVSQIQSSQYFVAELGSQMTGKEKSNGLFPGSAATVVSKEFVPSTTFFALQHGDIIPGTLFFSEKSIFAKEVSTVMATALATADPNRTIYDHDFSGGTYSIDPTAQGWTLSWAVSELVTNQGEYFVDYESGNVSVETTASGRGTCRYIYRQYPWYVRWSPVAVYSLRDTDYREKVFEDEKMLDNSTQKGLPSSEGVEVYTQIFEKSPCLWGK